MEKKLLCTEQCCPVFIQVVSSLYHLARRLPPGIEVMAKSRHLNCSSGSSDPYEDYLCFYFYQGNTCKWFKKPNRAPGLYKKWRPLPHPSSSPIPTPQREPLPTLVALQLLVCTSVALCDMFTLQSLDFTILENYLTTSISLSWVIPTYSTLSYS